MYFYEFLMGDKRKHYDTRQCWKCEKSLNFDDFHSTNRSLGKKIAIKLWQNPLYEFFCCSCFRQEEMKRYEVIRKRILQAAREKQRRKQREIIERIKGKKILIFGIQNTGKTAIINAIRDRCLHRIFNLPPTRGKSIQDVCINNVRHIIWDLGGVLTYRLRWVKTKDFIFPETNEIVYLIDIQNTSSYMDSIKYLSEIIQVLNLEEIKDTLDSNFRIDILFHKADPEIDTSTKIIENINFLTHCIENLEIPFEYEITKTSLFNFQRNYSEQLFINTPEFNTLLTKLFSSCVIS
jgi:ribosome biogenesis GTPase A